MNWDLDAKIDLFPSLDVFVPENSIVLEVVNDTFSKVYSAGRDRTIKCTDIASGYSELVCTETAPVLKLEWATQNESLFVSTTDSSIKKWEIGGGKQNVGHIPVTRPSYTIKGSSGIKNYHILNDKQHILTIDTADNVALWNVLTASKVEDLGIVDFETEIKKRKQMIFVPNWFAVDLKTGLLTLHLEENDIFTSWISRKDEMGCDIKSLLNLGMQILQSLLQHWSEIMINSYPDSDDASADRTDIPMKPAVNHIPDHTPIIFSEVNCLNKTLLRLSCKEAAGETENKLLNDYVPHWVYDAIVKKTQPKFTKISFTLVSGFVTNGKMLTPSQLSSSSLSASHGSTLKNNSLQPRRDRLSANEMILVRKVIEHIHEKNLLFGGGDHYDVSRTESSVSIIPEDHIELLCNDTILDLNMDLRTVRHFIWKQAGDLTLHYRPIQPTEQNMR